MMASKEVNANAIFNLHLSLVLAITATPPPRLSWWGLWSISYPGGSSSAMVQFDGFHISVKASTSRLPSIIRSLMSNALLQTEQAFYNPMVIFAAASMEVNSAEEISLDLDLGCHILYLNRDFLTLRLSLWEWRCTLCMLEPASPGTGHPRRKSAMVYGQQMTWFCSWLERQNEALHDCRPEKWQGALQMA